jgi:hypothetical protein
VKRKRKRKIDEPIKLSEIPRADRETAQTWTGASSYMTVTTDIQKDIDALIRKGWKDITPKGAAPYRWFRAKRKYNTWRTIPMKDRE